MDVEVFEGLRVPWRCWPACMRRAMALAMLLGMQSPALQAQASDELGPSVAAWLPACRALLAESMGDGAACAGAVDALLYVGELLPQDYRFCVPVRTPRQTVVAGIVEDIDALRPEVDRQHFNGTLLAILRYRWPCRD